jgi:uncharacterized membrane protein
VLRRELARHDVARDHYFRWRGREVSRVEAISDAVFGFAVTLLVVSLEAPTSFSALKSEMLSVPVFAASFTILLLIWFKQYRFFRRFGLEDVMTTVLNFALLFVVLVYVYPLKFLFTGLFAHSSAHLALTDYPSLYLIYSAGYVLGNAIFVALYRHVLAYAKDLELSPVEIYEAKTEIAANAVVAAIGLLVPLVSVATPVGYVPWVGLLYLLAFPAVRIVNAVRGGRRPAFS